MSSYSVSALYEMLINLDSIEDSHEFLTAIKDVSRGYEEVFSEGVDESSRFNASNALSSICWKLKNRFSDQVNVLSNDVVFFSFRGGVCNRFRALCGYKTLADVLGKRFHWVWSQNRDCKGDFDGRENVVLSGYQKLSELIEYCLNSTVMPCFYFDPNPASVIYTSDSRLSNVTQKRFNQLFSDNQKRFIVSGVGDWLGRSELSEITSKLPPNYLGVHVRRTDMIPYLSEKYPDREIPSIERIIDVVRSVSSGENFFLCSDDQETEICFSKLLGSNLVTADNDFDIASFRQTSFRETLIDLYVLSCSERIVGTFGSSFTQYASSVAKCKPIFPEEYLVL